MCSPPAVLAMGDCSLCLQLPGTFCTLPATLEGWVTDSMEPRCPGLCVPVTLGAVEVAGLQAPVVLPAI